MSQVKKIIYAVSVLAGTIIGVGMFALPYAALKAGFWVVIGYFLILGSLTILIHYIFGELSLITADMKRLPGFARIYFGRWGERIALVSGVLGLLGALLAYAIVGGEFLLELLSPYFGGNYIIYTITYLAVASIIILFGIKTIAKVEFWGLILFILASIAIFFMGRPYLQIANLSQPSDASQLFLPYGIVLFSLWGAAIIPEVEEMLGNNKKLIRVVIPVSIIIAIVVYIFFTYLILGITGNQTTESGLGGLKNILGGRIVNFMLALGILTTFTSFVTVGLTLEKIFWYDLKIRKVIAWAITCFVPLGLFLIGIKSFIPVISLAGAIMLGIDGILILLMYTKATKKKSVLLLATVLLIGIICEIFYFFR